MSTTARRDDRIPNIRGDEQHEPREGDHDDGGQMTTAAAIKMNLDRQLLELEALDAIFGPFTVVRKVFGAVRDRDTGAYSSSALATSSCTTTGCSTSSSSTSTSGSRTTRTSPGAGTDDAEAIHKTTGDIVVELAAQELVPEQNEMKGDFRSSSLICSPLTVVLRLPRRNYPEGGGKPVLVEGFPSRSGIMVLPPAALDESQHLPLRKKFEDFLAQLPDDMEVLQDIATFLTEEQVAATSTTPQNGFPQNLQNGEEIISPPPPGRDHSSSSRRLAEWFRSPAFAAALADAGFHSYGPDCWAQSGRDGRGVTIEQVEENVVSVSCDGLEPEDVESWLELEMLSSTALKTSAATCSSGGTTEDEINAEDLQERRFASSFPSRLLQWARAAASEDGFLTTGGGGKINRGKDDLGGGQDVVGTTSDNEDVCDSDDDDDDLSICTTYLPQNLKYDKTRSLAIYTWGRAILKTTPKQAQANFNATVLSGKGSGINLKKMNGLSLEIQSKISRCSLFPVWMEMVVKKVEAENFHAIAVNCRKGRHRSVAAAELLKKLYYPNARTHHLTIC
ncbi:unnamed protein product [Amoebophrya sp. A120]|nr:unnamed protein product [Amoebophrya sp. A120]|eukprot:GSA120T00025030001.1